MVSDIPGVEDSGEIIAGGSNGGAPIAELVQCCFAQDDAICCLVLVYKGCRGRCNTTCRQQYMLAVCIALR